MDFEFKIAIYDEKDMLDFPFWIHVVENNVIEKDLHDLINQSVVKKLADSGVHLIKVLNFGKLTQSYSDF